MLSLDQLKNILGNYQPRQTTEDGGFHRAGVLVTLFPATQGFSTILTKRTDLVDTHKGQVSFPGGMIDETDADITATALREAREEIGLDTRDVVILGKLDDQSVPSGFIITPVVAYLADRPQLTPHAVEVAEVFDAPLAFFANEKNSWTEEREFRGQKRTVWFYSYQGRIIWGATAAIIRNLASALGISRSVQ